MGGLEGREIDNFPFLQGIKELLNTPSRNIVIEEVFRDDIEKALERGKVKYSEEGEVTRVLCWSEEVPPILKKVESLAFLEDYEGKWKTQRRKIRVSKKFEVVIELNVDVRKFGKQSRRTKKMVREVASGRKLTLESMTKVRK